VTDTGVTGPGAPRPPAPTLSELFPLRMRAIGAATRKAHLIPAIWCVLVAVALAVTAGGNNVYWLRVGGIDAYPIPAFNLILGPAIAAAGVYVIYRLGGKPVAWWLLLLPAVVEIALLQPEVFAVLRRPFAAIAAGTGDPTLDDFHTWSLHALVAVAPLEEFIKAAPILLGWWLAGHARGWVSREAGVREPLDGILLGCASGAAFACYETLVLYVGGLTAAQVPLSRDLYDAMRSVATNHLATAGADPRVWLNQFAVALHSQTEILFARLVNQLACHVAWTGLVGYYIGLAALRPWGRARSLATGFTIAILLHWVWDCAFHSAVDRRVTIIVAGLTAVVSYTALVTAILKARQISPHRAINFATTGTSGRHDTLSAGARLPLRLVLATSRLRLEPGVELAEGDIVGLMSADDCGAIARVESHPHDAATLGLHNLSTGAWTARSPDGSRCVVGQGSRIRLDPGLAIDFGQAHGRVEQATVAQVWGAEGAEP
jgi:RsiW-degrading membrane proteinase PrsW (M82 family)